jgi:Fe-S cluster assembly iron-binding protein IscA
VTKDAEPDEMIILQVTEAALTMVCELRANEDDHESLALWIEVTGSGGNAYTYDMYFQSFTDAQPADWSDQQGTLSIVVPAASVDRVRGSILDVTTGENGPGMAISNPNQPPIVASPAMAGPPADLSGDVAQRIVQVLEERRLCGVRYGGGDLESGY